MFSFLNLNKINNVLNLQVSNSFKLFSNFENQITRNYRIYTIPKTKKLKPRKPDFIDLPPSPTPSGWRPPSGADLKLDFFISRTPSKNLPVYLAYKNGRTRCVTIVRKIEGDINKFQKVLEDYIGEKTKRRVATIEVKGNKLRSIRAWLLSKGY
eukprot:TRINITY_DN104_c1_g1_i1.p1 TRINITY_DN104_c1_g1~~TRINITY_DN104_c1_g1_i1.p1  ORF type:complete len:179 (+),score=70.98 TRINITY_DN104_c1_g1_i1:78-539(+)